MTESITGRFLDNCPIDICLFYPSFSYYTGIVLVFIKWGPNTFDFLMCPMVFDKVPFCPHILFTVYIDDLSNRLNRAEIGCHVHNCCTSHVFYADDLCEFCWIFVQFGFENDIVYNPIRSLCMICFQTRRLSSEIYKIEQTYTY